MKKGANEGRRKEVKMRSTSLLLFGIVIASCAVAATAPNLDNERQFQRLVAGKVAQPPTSCMPYQRSRDMIVLDPKTVVFKNGTERVYVAHMTGGCNNLGGPGPYALVTRQTTGALCHGDIAEVVDTMAHITVGSCTFDNFVPYVRAGAR